MYRFKPLNGISLFVVMSFIFSCKNDLVEIKKNSPEITSRNARKGINDFDENAILGKKKNNPYSLINIKKALKELNLANKPKQLDANFYYVRLEPTDSVAVDFLQNTRDIYAYMAPLDFKIENNGIKYKEPDYEGKLQVFWAAIPTSYKLPKNINAKIIDELFLPLGDGRDGGYARGYEEGFLKALDTKTLELFDEDSFTNKKAKVKGVTQIGNGNVTVYDDFLNTYLPIVGVEVRMKRWFTTRYAITNTYGGFSNSTYNFGGPIDFSIGWFNNDYELINGVVGTAGTNQNNVPGFWFASINKSNSASGNIKETPSYIFAHVYRAAYNYYNNNASYGINAPPRSIFGPLGGKLKIKCKPNALSGSHFFFTNGGGLADPSIVIESDPSSATDISSRRIFATTTHELAHASHWVLGFTASDYLGSKKKATLAESWAMGVEWVITNSVYSNLAASYGLTWSNYERPDRATQPKPINFWLNYVSGSTIGSKRDDFYTPLFIDLMDNENQFSKWPFSSTVDGISYGVSYLPYDYVNGFSLSFLETKLTINTTSWAGLKNTLIATNPTSSSTAQIQYLFDTYEN